jgi:predicted dehydrogenase
MLELALADTLITDALATGRIGTPVAVRMTAHVSEGFASGDSLAMLAHDSAARWLRARPVRVERFSCGSAESIIQLAAFDGGQSALLATGTAKRGKPLLQITVFGNRGVVNWEEAACFARPSSPQPATPRPAARPPLDPSYGVLLVAGDHTHQPNYAAAFAADSRCRLVGLTDDPRIGEPRRRLNRQLADRLSIPLLDDFDCAVLREDVHIVSICAEPVRRGPLIVRAAAAGKHLYLDKPLAGSLDDLEEACGAVQRAGVLAHMFSSLTASWVAQLRQQLQSPCLGQLLAIHLDLCFAKGHAGTARLGTPRRETFPPSCYEVADAKRELTNVGVYPLVLLAALCGRRPCRVAAMTGNYFFAEHQQQDMEDFGQIALELEGGLIASCTAGRTGWQSHPADGLNRVTLIGSAGLAVIEAHRPRVETWSNAPPWQPPARNPLDPMGMWVSPPNSPYAAVSKHAWLATPTLSPHDDVQYFLDCLETGRESEVEVSTAAQASRILLAAYRSAAQSTAIDLPFEHPADKACVLR